MKIFVVAFVFAVAIGTLIWVGVASAGTPVLKVSDLLNGNYDQQHAGKRVQIDNGNIVAIESRQPMRFDIASKDSPDMVVHVVCERSAPDNFKVDVHASCTGTFDSASRTFTAAKVATKCPTKYEPTEDSEEPYSDVVPASDAQ